MTLQFSDGTPFTCGACRYLARPATPTDTLNRPFLPISVEGQLLDAAFDTGGFFLILQPELREILNLQPEDGEFFEGLILRGGGYDGYLHRVTLTLEVERGETCHIEVSAFVPVDPYASYQCPNFIGWTECLERFRFAFEPAYNDSDGWFHFGPLNAI